MTGKPGLIHHRHRLGLTLLTLASLGLAAGCGPELETAYGSSRGGSVNGTGAFAAALRGVGHEARPAWRLTEELAGWADVIVRFAPYPGPPAKDEAEWYGHWLDSGTGRRLVYVVRDYDAEAEYWRLVLQGLTDPADSERRADAEASRDRASGWVARLPGQREHPADPDAWFATEPAVEPPAVCTSLDGELAAGLDASRAAVTLHAPLKAGDKRVLLRGDGKALVLEWETHGGGRVLAVANGSFLLNLPLVNPERRVLAGRIATWIGTTPRRVAFVEGSFPLGGFEPPPTLWDLIARIEGFRWTAIQFALFGLLACLARAPRLGRPRSEPASDADRPAAHAEALGALLRRGRASGRAREILAHYRRWRFPRTDTPGG
jgi:hypothetical protein